MRTHVSLLVVSFVFLVTACSNPQPAPQEQAPAPPYKIIATIKDIMDSAVDPSADFIWESIAIEVSDKGTVEKQPRTDDEWKEERRRAVVLVEAANLLMMPGRHVAQAGEKSENPGIELSPEEIEELINKDRPAFLDLAGKFQDVAIEQLKAVDAKDITTLFRVGGDLDTTCENCHRKYWYPNDPFPPQIDPNQPADTKPAGTK